jgi:excisionase family DNA binding protein
MNAADGELQEQQMNRVQDDPAGDPKGIRNSASIDRALVVTIDQAAVMLQLGRVSVYKLLRTGKLEGRLFGRARRITRASIDRLVGAV